MNDKNDRLPPVCRRCDARPAVYKDRAKPLSRFPELCEKCHESDLTLDLRRILNAGKAKAEARPRNGGFW